MSVSKGELHKAIENCPSTASWDVLVSYSEDKLNHLLAKQWGKSPSFKELSFDVVHRKGTRHEYTTHYDIKLGSPTLQFQSKKSEPVATLVMSIEGSRHNSDDDPDQVDKIEPGYFSLAVHVLLTNMSGDHEVNHDGPEHTIRFDNNVEASQYIVFHFQNEQNTWELISHKEPDPEMSEAAQSMYHWLADPQNVQWIDYKVAEVSNKKNTDPNNDILRPVCFRFSALSGALNIFIQVSDHQSKEGYGGKDLGFRHNSNKPILPFAQGYDACIILSNRLFQDAFLIPELKSQAAAAVSSIEPCAVKSGIQLAFCLENQYFKQYKKGKMDWGEYKLDEVDVKFDENPLRLNIVDEEKSLNPIVAWDWHLEAKNIKWSEDPKLGIPATKAGVVDINADIPNPDNKENSSLVQADDVLKPIINFTEAHQPKMTFTSHKEKFWMEKFPEDFKKQLTIKLPLVIQQVRGLDFFATQNVFAPGQQFITVSDIMVPYDVVLMGKMED